MNQLSGAEAMVRMLDLFETRYLFGLCGDTSLPFYDALQRLDHNITHVLTRDERSAAYMADGYARVSGRVGVCEGPSGGGATYILPGVVEANESSVPLLAITTDISVTGRGRYTLTELDQEALFRPLTKWNRVITQASRLPATLRAAFAQMSSGRPGAVHLGLPLDVQREPVDDTEIWGDPALARCPAHRVAPDPAAIHAAAELLAGARAPLIVCGGGPLISGAEPELRGLAEVLEAPVATSISGQGVIPEDHPLALGVVGSNGGTLETREILGQADVVLFVGCRAGSVTTERWQYPARDRAKIIHIDVDPAVIGANYPTAVGVVGDARLTLQYLKDILGRSFPEPPTRELGRAAVARARAAKFAAFRELAASDTTPIRPERVVHELQQLLPRGTVIVADPGTPCPYLSAYYQVLEPGRRLFSNRAHGALGYSLAAAMGACHARPGERVLSVMGDGSFGFAVGELETAVRLQLPVTMVVFSNATYGWIKAGQKSSFDARYFSVDFSRTEHARVAEAYGIPAWRVENPGELRDSLARALECEGPSLVDVVSQPLHEARAPVSEWIA